MGIEERKEREKNERRESVLRAAIEVYQREGYHGTTMEKIALEAELSRATLYLYFKTKDEIFVHAIVSFLGAFGDMLEDLYARRERDGDLFDELWGVFKRFYRKDPVTFSASLYFHQSEMIRSLTEELRLLLAEAGSRNYQNLCRIMEHGVKTGEFRPCNPKTLAEVVWTSFLGIIHLENSKKAMARNSHLDEAFELAQAILSDALRAGGTASCKP